MSFDPTSLQSFSNAAAGHAGVLSDPSNSVVVKPCTAKEVAFYTSLTAHPTLLPYVPVFMGSLSLSDKENQPSTTDSSNKADEQTEKPDDGKWITAPDGTLQRAHGKKLDTDLHIVLSNATAGFARPNVLDLKLGARLWDDDTKLEKRERLDKVAAQTTSGSLGFRIAGMRTWAGSSGAGASEDAAGGEAAGDLEGLMENKDGFRVYNKMYGRSFDSASVKEGFEAYVYPSGVKGKSERRRAAEVLRYFVDEVCGLADVLEAEESRMYSASLLLVYEGDGGAYEETARKMMAAAEEGGELELEDEDDEPPRLALVKMIDFAHAKWTPGEGRDENALRGIRAVIEIFEEMLREAEDEE